MTNSKSHVFDNIGNLQDLLKKHNDSGCGKLHLIGHEKKDWLIVKWNIGDKTKIGLYNYPDDKFQEMLSLKGNINVIQASINQNLSLISFVTRSPDDVYSVMLSQPWSYLKQKVTQVASWTPSKKKIDLIQQSKLQSMSQFVNQKIKADSDEEEEEDVKSSEENHKLLIFVHHKSIIMYNCKVVKDIASKECEVKLPLTVCETLCTKPTWAQWDVNFQTLYFVYNKLAPPPSSSTLEDRSSSSEEDTLHPMLSALQFHDDMPHETVLNIPVNVPVSLEPFGGYLDDPVPLRIHDGSMDMLVVTDARGVVCLCHHYLYQVVQPPKSGCDTVHFAYSVIMLHHSTMLHASVSGVQFDRALDMRPTFLLIDDYLMVHAPGLFLHYLDTSLTHSPSANLFLPSPPSSRPAQYLPLLSHSLLDMISLSLFTPGIKESALVEYASDNACSLERKLAILHYFTVHRNSQAAVSKILEPLGEQISDPMTGSILQEVLIGSTYAQTVATFNSDTQSFVHLLPCSVNKYPTRIEMKLSKACTLSIAQDSLTNPISAMLLSPQQRLNPYRRDVWNLLYECQKSERPGRFVPQTVVNKLLVSLHCYQPEVLSRCNTPMSPSTAMGSNSDLLRSLRFKEPLPFVEKEQVTATKQEHITSVNLRELSIHLLKCSGGRNTKTPLYVHSVATQYVATQVEVSRWLCYVITCAARLKPSYTRGFQYIDTLTPWESRILFLLYDRFNSCCGCIGFPVPPGFTSFFAYLSYRTLDRSMFLQYVERGVFELNIDVIKAVFADIPDDKTGTVHKLNILNVLPRSRVKRILNHWPHPLSLLLRAREHALSVLAGTHSSHHRYRRGNGQGKVSINSHDMLPCFDSFLRLLVAKVNLNELDVQLLLDATTSSLSLT